MKFIDTTAPVVSVMETPIVVPAPVAEPVETDPKLAELEAKLAAAKARTAAATKAREASADDPAVKLAEAKLALAREERAAKLAEHELAVDAVYRAACLERGQEMVARIPTRDGSIVIRGETEQENDERERLCGAFRREAERATNESDRARYMTSIEEQARISLTKLILSDKAHFQRVAAKYQIWGSISLANAALASGRVIAEGKGVGA